MSSAEYYPFKVSYSNYLELSYRIWTPVTYEMVYNESSNILNLMTLIGI